MKVRCLDCVNPTSHHANRDYQWLMLPSSYFQPRHATLFWQTAHGHIPRAWQFRCEGCGETVISGGVRAVEEGWDDFMLAQHDWGFYMTHRAHELTLAHISRSHKP